MCPLTEDHLTDLDSLAAEYWQAHLAWRPISATSVGERAYDAQIDDRSPEAVESQRVRLTGILDRARALPARFDDADGADPDAVTASALVEQLESELAGIGCELDDWTVDPLEGPQVMAFNIEALQPIRTVAEGHAMVERWRRIPGWFDQHVENLRRGLSTGRVAVHSPVARVVATLDELLASPIEELGAAEPDAPAAHRLAERRRRGLPSDIREAVVGRSGRRSGASATRSATRSCPRRDPTSVPGSPNCPAVPRPTGGSSGSIPRSIWTRPTSTRRAWPKWSASTRN